MNVAGPGADAACSSSDPSDDPRLIEVLEEYQGQLNAGRTPDRRALALRYPELAEAVEHCIEGLDFVRQSKLHDGLGGTDDVPLPAAVRFDKPLGDFRIIREIARGGMGVVYEAIQLSLNRHVALKVLPLAETLDPRKIQRFTNEAQAAALLHHSNIVPIYAVGCDSGVHFYAMQLIDGQSLAVALNDLRWKSGHREEGAGSQTETFESNNNSTAGATRAVIGPAKDPRSASRESPDSEATNLESTIDDPDLITQGAPFASDAYIRRIARLMIEAAEALEHAHQVGVVHRDIKPANLILDASGKLWVTDFGLAQLRTEQTLTQSGDFLGTLRYMSPEQAGGHRASLDHRTDIYSLGATSYELLTMESVASGATYQEVLYQILHQEPRSLRQLNRAIPAELETIVLKALSKNPAERYSTAGDFAADMQRFLNHEPIKARRPTPWERCRKWSRRHPSAVVAALILLLVVAVGSLISNHLIGLQQQRTTAALIGEQRRADEAEQHFQQARAAVDALFEISEEELAGKPEQALRRQILGMVLNYYQDFIDERKDDPSSRAELIAAQSRVRKILSQLDSIDQGMHMQLLANASVQKELKLTADQIQKLQTVWSRPALPNSSKPLTEDELRTQMAANAVAHEKVVAGVLTPEQLKRFRQISIQSQGLSAFDDPTIVAILHLSAEQRTKIRDMQRAAFFTLLHPPDIGPRPGDSAREPDGIDPSQKEARRAMEGGGKRNGSGAAERAPPTDLIAFGRKNLLKEALALLNEDQLKKWNELTGEPFSGFDDRPPPGFAPFHGPPFGSEQGPRFGSPPP